MASQHQLNQQLLVKKLKQIDPRHKTVRDTIKVLHTNQGNDVIPGVDGKTWQYTACNYCKNKGHIARLCPKLAAKKGQRCAKNNEINQQSNQNQQWANSEN